MTGGEARVVNAGEVDGAALDAFLRRFFSAAHCDFLRRHGDWWHPEPRQRMVTTVGDTIAGYSAVISSPCRLGDDVLPAHWWVDLVVDPAFRGRGLQGLMDRRVREGAALLLGFPNALAARIHRQHGWGVSEQHRILLLPFEPPRLRPVTRAAGARGIVLRAAARLARPLGGLLRRRAAGYRPASAHRLDDPRAGALAEIFARHHPGDLTTTARDAEYLKWRYLDAPYRGQLTFFAAGEPSPRAVAITRTRPTERGLIVKLLDLFGDLEDTALINDLLRRVARQAAREKAVELTAFATLPHLFPLFRAAGFVLATTGRSCWHSSDPGIMRRLDRRRSHWTLGDSDQEEPA